MSLFMSEGAGLFGLLFFFLIFLGIFGWAYWPTNKSELEELKNIPLENDGKEVPHGRT